MSELLVAIATGEHGPPPASVVGLSGDVHNAYLYRVASGRGSEAVSKVWQAVCSPVRNPLTPNERRLQKFATSRTAWLITRLVARAASVGRPSIRWRPRDRARVDKQN